VYQAGTAFAGAVDSVRDGRRTVDEAAAALRARLTDDELLWLLDGDLTLIRGGRGMSAHYNGVPFEGGRVDRLGIPGIRFTDGPRGIVMGNATSFPVAIARAATFDVDLEHRVGAAIGAEGRALRANLFAGICVNVPPFPGWGRSQESYGEDPVLAGAMGAALTQGVHPWLLTCVKHFALNSMEEARFTVDVRVDEDVLHEVYLPHFRTVVEAGADAVMSAYNSVNGRWAGENHHLLTRILRGAWGFAGFVMTDFVFGLRHPVESVAAGQDLEMPFRQQRRATLPRALRDGRLARADVERAAGRLIAAQLRLALRAVPAPSPDVVAGAEHRRLAREAAARGAVLLRNEPVDGIPALPLSAAGTGRVAVLGRLADAANLGDTGSSRVRPPATVSVLHGLRERLGDRVVHVASTDPASAAQAAAEADAAVVVVGLGPADEGEAMIGIDTDAAMLFGGVARIRWVAAAVARLTGVAARRTGIAGGDRRDLHLHPDDVALITAVAATNPRTVVVVIAGGTVMVDPWDGRVAAVLLAWYPGMEGGHAVADLLLGDAEPTGRLPVAIPRRRVDLPEVDWRARRVDYPRWFGQRKLDRDGVAAAYPFGHGLGYTRFAVDSITVAAVERHTFRATVTVTNTGARAGRHVVQVYATVAPDAHPTLPTRALVGFRSVVAEPGASVTATVECSTRPLQVWTGDGFAPGLDEVTVEAASYAGDPGAATAVLRLR
jgi:beta-glucosidase